MKIVLGYPPFITPKGHATLGQNRQFQYFKAPTYIYPVVPAIAATMLSRAGHQVIWLDCIARGITQERFLEIIQEENPDLIAFETKTPVIKQHWKIIDAIKSLLLKPNTYNLKPIIVLFGDHVTALPEESFQNSQVDFVLTGGDYDFLLLNLCGMLEKSARLQASSFRLQVQELEPGIYYREGGAVRNTGKFELKHDLDSAPYIDRDLTQWKLYAYQNGNYKRTPGTYIMSGRDCWWGRCTFCSWPTLYPVFRKRSVPNVLNEIESVINHCGAREIMDDSGCFPAGDWLTDFCQGMIQRELNRRVYVDCNMRFGALSIEEFKLMKKANFRLLLFGLESANQNTLDRVDKNLKVERIIEDCRAATAAGLFPHITVMFGFPWEDYTEAQKTLALGSWLLKKGYAYTMQATMVIPYPGSRLFAQCRQNGWLKSLDWDAYDMKQPIMQSAIPDSRMTDLVQKMYGASLRPEFIMRKILSLRDIDDLRYFARAAGKIFGHLADFSVPEARG